MIPRLRWATASVLAVGAIYAGAWLVLPHDGLFINDNGCKLIQTEGFVRNGFADLSVPWPGRDIDPGLQFRPLGDPFGEVIDGRLYVSFPIPFALLSSVPYRFFGVGGLDLLPWLAGLLLLPAIVALARLLEAGRWGTALAVPAVALGTPVWFYALTFWEHLPAVCLVTWGLVCVLRYLTGGPRRQAVLGAALCGLATWLRDDFALLAVVLAAIPFATGRRWRWDAVLLPGVFAATLAPLWGAQWAALGTPLGLHATSHGPLDQGVGRYLIDRWTVFRDLVVDSHDAAWVSLLVAGPFILLLALHPRLERRRFRQAVRVCLAWAIAWGLVALAGHLRSAAPIWYLQSANGLFAVSPFLILACLRELEEGPRPGAKVRAALWSVVSIFLFIYVMAAPPVHVGGIHWGSRLLLPLFPLLGVLAAETAGRFIEPSPGAPPGRALLLPCLALILSIAFQLHGLRLLDAQERFAARLGEAVSRSPETVVVATSWVVPQEIARCFYAKSVFLARTPADLDRLLALLRSKGERRVLRIDAAPATAGWAGSGGGGGDDRILTDDLGFVSYRLRSVVLP